MTTCQGEGPRSGSFVYPRSEVFFRALCGHRLEFLVPSWVPRRVMLEPRSKKGAADTVPRRETGNGQRADDYDERVLSRRAVRDSAG